MALSLQGYIGLPAHIKPGGFDHAAIHSGRARLYVAHTCNDALDVIDCAADQYLYSISDLTGVAGALVAELEGRVFTSNRGENTVGIFSIENENMIARVPVGVRPNGLAYSPAQQLLLAANVGDPKQPGAFTVSLVDAEQHTRVAELPVGGRTRWTVYDAQAQAFYVNIADPAQIVVIATADLTRIDRVYTIPAAGPHGLDLDEARQRLFCACDSKKLVCLDAHTGAVLQQLELGGSPDVIFFNPALCHLYVASGEPGIIEVFDTETLQRIETVSTEPGAHTLAIDAQRNKVYAFLPQTHRAAIFVDQG